MFGLSGTTLKIDFWGSKRLNEIKETEYFSGSSPLAQSTATFSLPPMLSELIM